MYNFVFHNPTKILFGKNQIANVYSEIPEDAKILIVYGGGSIKTNGIYDQVIDALGDLVYHEFSGIEPNPTYETCMKAVDMANDYEIDFILAVGGGSVIDAAKFIAAACCYEVGDPWEILDQRIEVEDALPLGVILTLPATGSEMNRNSVISSKEHKQKLAFASLAVLPIFSVLDPSAVASLPQRQIANGIFDSFVHVLEQYLTYPVNGHLQDRFAEGILLTLIEQGPKVMADPEDYDAAASFMWCSTLALNGLIGVGVPSDFATHMIGHEITALHGVDHARTLAIVLPGVMNVMRETKKDKILQYGRRIFGIKEPNENKAIDLAIEKTIAFCESIGIKTRLSDYQIKRDIIDEICDRMEERGAVDLGENKLIGIDEIKAILKDRL